MCTSLGHGRNSVLKIFDDEIYIPLVVQLDPCTVTSLHHRVRAVSNDGFVGVEFVRGERFFDGGSESVIDFAQLLFARRVELVGKVSRYQI